MSDLTAMFQTLLGCCLHNPQWTPDQVEQEIAWIGDRELGSESQSLVIVQLTGGQWGLLTQSEDYTGHGCQCDAMTVKAATLRDLLTHLTDHELCDLIARTAA